MKKNPVDDVKAKLVVVRAAAILATTLACFGPARASAQSFGGAVAVAAGGEVVVGHPACAGVVGGCVYVYSREGGEWVETATIMSPVAAVGDGFGSGLAASEGRLLVAAAGSGDGEPGAIHVFSRTADGWTPDGAMEPEGLPEHARLGNVVLRGDLAAVAVSIRPPDGLPTDGMVLVFRDTGDGWVQEAVLESPSSRRTLFGEAMALGDGMLVVGAARAGALAGAGYVYERGAGGWDLTGELAGAGPASFFGAARAGGRRPHPGLGRQPLDAAGAGRGVRARRGRVDRDGAHAGAGRRAPGPFRRLAGRGRRHGVGGRSGRGRAARRDLRDLPGRSRRGRGAGRRPSRERRAGRAAGSPTTAECWHPATPTPTTAWARR